MRPNPNGIRCCAARCRNHACFRGELRPFVRADSDAICRRRHAGQRGAFRRLDVHLQRTDSGADRDQAAEREDHASGCYRYRDAEDGVVNRGEPSRGN